MAITERKSSQLPALAGIAMRTATIDLPNEVLAAAEALARKRHASLSETIADLIRRETQEVEAVGAAAVKLVDGFPTLAVGRSISADEVHELLDEDS